MALQPGGLLAPDPGALSPAQLEQLRNFKIQTRIANEEYLRTHKEVKLLLSGFFREIFLKRPDNIREFAAGSSGCERVSPVVTSVGFQAASGSVCFAKAFEDTH